MPGEVLLDTNVVVYAYDPRDSTKQAVALSTLDHLARTGRGRLSTQVLGEFFVAATQKLDPPLTAAEGYEQVEALAMAWPILPIAPLIPLEAARGVRDHRLPYWDAQLWATARLNQISIVLSEDRDLADRVLEGVQFVNPFSPSFTLASLR
jgi:predicted nucleic acid-binding protein